MWKKHSTDMISLMASNMIHQVNFCSFYTLFLLFFIIQITQCVLVIFFRHTNDFFTLKWRLIIYNNSSMYWCDLYFDMICYVFSSTICFFFFKKDLECVMGLWSIQNLWNLMIICISKILFILSKQVPFLFSKNLFLQVISIC